MVTDSIINALSWLFAGVIGLFPTITVPEWADTLTSYMGDGADFAAGMAHWVPVAAIGQGLVFVFACWGVANGIKLIRIVVSLFSGGGGSAA